MGTRRLQPLDALRVRQLPQVCPSCLLDTAESGARSLPPSWAVAAEQRYGLCGVVAFDEQGDVAGWLLIAPAFSLPRHYPLSHGTRTADAGYLVGACVLPNQRGVGVGRHLVQSLAGHLIESASSVEALGSRHGSQVHAPPEQWLREVGFERTGSALNPEHPDLVRMRLDLTNTVRWRPDLKSAWDRLTGWLPRPSATPEPSGRISPRHGSTAAPNMPHGTRSKLRVP